MARTQASTGKSCKFYVCPLHAMYYLLILLININAKAGSGSFEKKILVSCLSSLLNPLILLQLFVKDSNLVNRLLLNKLSYLRIGRSSINDQISIQFKHTEAFTFQYFIKKTHQRAGLTSKPKLLCLCFLGNPCNRRP